MCFMWLASLGSLGHVFGRHHHHLWLGVHRGEEGGGGSHGGFSADLELLQHALDALTTLQRQHLPEGVSQPAPVI